MNQLDEMLGEIADGWRVPEYPPRFVSGVQPALFIHLGHFFGAVRQHIQLAHQYPGQCFIMVADLHGLTKDLESNRIKGGTLEVATTYLSLGLDPSKAVLYRQSDLAEITELFWILNCLTSTSELLRHAIYKHGVREKKSLNAGFLTYPVLMAADVLALRATHIPVGNDQWPNVNRVREIARHLNESLKREVVPLPEPFIIHPETIVGYDGRKMSEANQIPLFQRFDKLRDSVNRIPTDSKGLRERKDSSQCLVFKLYSLVAAREKVTEMADRYERGTIGYSEAKEMLVRAVAEYFAPYLDRYHELKTKPDLVWDVLRSGFPYAREEVLRTLYEVKSILGLNY